jgi:radical SAM protein with 4Fe4S-binding SPASM domain
MFDLNKGPKFIHLDLTAACNLKCIHCRATSKPGFNELKIEEIIKFLDFCKKEFPNWEAILIGGGEPLIREKDLFSIMEHVKNLRIKCYLNTNGTLINSRNVTKIKKFVEITQISLDGANPATHDYIRGKKGAFNEAIKGIVLLRKNKARVYVRITLSMINYLEAFDLIDLALKLGVEAVSYYRTLPVGRAKKYNISIDKRIYHLILKELMRQKYSLKGKLDIVSSDPLKVRMDNKLQTEIFKKYDISKSFGGCLPGITEIFINNIGNVYPCTMMPILLGNIRENSLREIWNNSQFLLKLRNRKNLKGCCKKCSIQRICGGCRAAAFGEHGDYFAEDPYCPNSFMKGNYEYKTNSYRKSKLINFPCQGCH